MRHQWGVGGLGVCSQGAPPIHQYFCASLHPSLELQDLPHRSSLALTRLTWNGMDGTTAMPICRPIKRRLVYTKARETEAGSPVIPVSRVAPRVHEGPVPGPPVPGGHCDDATI